ncbi:aldehyde dehydrogenase family protein [Escherichia coli]|nr:aldehyde dehydrogenase family protein [Escherichia coli]
MTITPATHAISINPATGEQLSVLPWAGVDDIENALQLAAAGFRDWREANIDYRAEKLRDIGKALRARSEEMAQMITREMGKPINQARAEVAKSANLCDWYAEHGPAMLKAEPTLVENQQAVIEYRPLGTILAIMPWNFPLWQVMRGAVPIILAGNGYLLKHAPNVMGCAQLIAQVFKDAGIPQRLFQEGHLLRNSIAIFVLTTLFYFIGAELRLVHELSLFWPLNGVMAGVFARYVWLNRLHYYAISYVAMLVYDAITTEWGLVSLAINFSNMMFIVTVALLVARDKRLGKNKYEPVSALRLFNYCLLAALLCAIVGAIGSVSIDSLDFWPLLADWFSEQFSTGVLIVPCMLTLAIPGVLPRFKAEQMMPAIALIVSVIASVVIGGAGSLAFPLPALIWCAVRYTPQVTCLLTFVTGAVEVVLVANSVIDISVGSPFSIPQMFSARLGIATMAICPIMVSFSVAAINSLMKQVALRADFDFLTQVYSRSGLYEALKSPSLKQTQHLTVMLLDIDYFKSINDNYGHECGDKVLSVFAQHIQKIVGDKGLVARMGGEEFAVAVPSVNPVDGLLMAEKIRKGVELQPFTWQQKTLYLTVSIGVGSGCASYRTLTDDFNKLMVEADTCLYRSKKDGRNRTSTMRYGEEVV